MLQMPDIWYQGLITSTYNSSDKNDPKNIVVSVYVVALEKFFCSILNQTIPVS